jgi:hypothetical protein
MDLINNLVHAGIAGKITPRHFKLPAELNGSLQPVDRGDFYSYSLDVIEEFCAFDEPEFIEDSIQRHWADLVTEEDYKDSAGKVVSSFVLNGQRIPSYHLIYAYLVENTRAAQIFEKLIWMYMHDEKLKKATTPNRRAFQWIMNTESLFFKYLSSNSYRNIASQIRISNDATRRNVYFRMFGMDLAFGDASNAGVSYHKAESNNQSFIILFEKFLSEIWLAYTNARNQVGSNTTDMFTIVDTAQKIQELLMSRRTTDTNFANYRYFNLSREEYASVVMMSWLYEVVSYDSPLVEFLRCNGNTPGERLVNIGAKVGLPAHSKSEGLLEIAPVMNTLLRRIELGEYNLQNEEKVRRIIESQSPALSPPGIAAEQQALTDILSIINNWEKATGHKIKNPGGTVSGTVRVQSNGLKVQPTLN